MQDDLQRIADALHALEKEPLSKRAKVRVSRLHRLMHEAVEKHGPALGIDVTPLSGGGAKPPAQ